MADFTLVVEDHKGKEIKRMETSSSISATEAFQRERKGGIPGHRVIFSVPDILNVYGDRIQNGPFIHVIKERTNVRRQRDEDQTPHQRAVRTATPSRPPDDVALALAEILYDERKNLIPSQVKGVALENGIPYEKFGHLSNGLQVMNLRNRIRHKLRKDGKVSVGGMEITK